MLREAVIELIAAACHQQNKTYCSLMGDGSQPLWLDTSSNIRDSMIAGVGGALDGNTAEQSHESWCEFRRKDGWVYGEKKDSEAKTHHCLVPYGDLPLSQRRKDEFFIEMVRQLGLVSGLISNNGET
ncbi:MAG: hypothetical protein JRG93_11135 [Deltaproteobacteria bacterium]|nr:hypothetical protein [Deltaproteobacteria bacterium]